MDTADPEARPLITASTSQLLSTGEAMSRAGASTRHRRAALIVSCRARSRELASSDCEKNDRRADTGASAGWAAGAGTTRFAGSRWSDAGSSPPADAMSMRSGTFGPGAGLDRYETVPITATDATMIALNILAMGACGA